MPDNDNLLSMFNNEQSNKDLGYSSSSDNEFISLDTFNERNRGAMVRHIPIHSKTLAYDVVTAIVQFEHCLISVNQQHHFGHPYRVANASVSATGITT